uniref:CUB and zona pellucida-like domains 1, tandem duplicate 1 n=1 Tax=Callorhinchus milii TaxID=7868 RepID=A0A4W3HEV8_CALMI
ILFQNSSTLLSPLFLIYNLTRGGPCGGYLENNTGSFTSPNYPYNYHNNARCTWYIQVDRNQIIKLNFNDLWLETSSNCRYDYVAIYDGPSTSYPLLAKICDSSNLTFTSSNNSMTVHFKTDSSVAQRGFSANYFSAPNDDTWLTCSTDYMEATISKSYLYSLGFNEYDVHLNDPYCRPDITNNHVIFKMPLNTCGTIRQANNDSITYSNTIRASPSATVPPNSVITRVTNLRINIGCQMEQDTMIKIMYLTEDDIVVNEAETGKFNVRMTFYDSPSFTTPVLNTPYYVHLSQKLYVQVNLNSSDSNLVIFVDTCTTSPSYHDWTSKTYDLIKNGCVRDDTYQTYSSSSRNIARFKFNAFKFLDLNSAIYLQCRIAVCKAYDYSSRCYRGCISRQKRDLNPSAETTDVVIGPIQLKKDQKSNEDQGIFQISLKSNNNFTFILNLSCLQSISKQTGYAYQQL